MEIRDDDNLSDGESSSCESDHGVETVWNLDSVGSHESGGIAKMKMVDAEPPAAVEAGTAHREEYRLDRCDDGDEWGIFVQLGPGAGLREVRLRSSGLDCVANRLKSPDPYPP